MPHDSRITYSPSCRYGYNRVAMSLTSILLQMLLILSLILNGSGYAMASVDTVSGEAQRSDIITPADDAIAATVSEIDARDCHEQAATFNATSAPDLASGTEHPDPAEHEHTSADCCQTDHCSCACMQLVHAVATESLAQPAALVHSQANVFKQSTHASPAMPHLIRPPIS